jgi:hypothetical protein
MNGGGHSWWTLLLFVSGNVGIRLVARRETSERVSFDPALCDLCGGVQFVAWACHVRACRDKQVCMSCVRCVGGCGGVYDVLTY